MVGVTAYHTTHNNSRKENTMKVVIVLLLLINLGYMVSLSNDLMELETELTEIIDILLNERKEK